MLVSHRKRFIFLKTVKTAGTSIEVYLERYCLPPDEPYEATEQRAEIVTPAGIIVYRGPQAQRTGCSFYNHMSAQEVWSALGADTWSEYQKVSCVRNPLDRLVSLFWFLINPEFRNQMNMAPFSETRATFQTWCYQQLKTGRLRSPLKILQVDGELAVDLLIRFETLLSDLEHVCSKLDIPFEPSRLSRYKSAERVSDVHFTEYYDYALASAVRHACLIEIEAFGYDTFDDSKFGRQV